MDYSGYSFGRFWDYSGFILGRFDYSLNLTLFLFFSCAAGYVGEYCQYERQAADTEEDDLLNIGVPILAAAAALAALTCLILALRRGNKDEEDEPSTSRYLIVKNNWCTSSLLQFFLL